MSSFINFGNFNALKLDAELKFEFFMYLEHSNSNFYEEDRLMLPHHFSDIDLRKWFGEILADNVTIENIIDLSQLSQKLVIFNRHE